MAQTYNKLFQRFLRFSPYCFCGGLVIFEKEEWNKMDYADLYHYLTSNFHLTEKQFSDKSQLIDFFDSFEHCIHKDKEITTIQESVSAEREWINKYIAYGQRTNGDTFIDECKAITKKQNDLKQQHANATLIDDSYWNMYKLLQVPNSSMACSQNVIFVLFHMLKDIIKDLSNGQKYDSIIKKSCLESKHEDDKLNILDCGCGIGLIGASIAHFYPYFDELSNKFGNKVQDAFNLYGFDHSTNALKYGMERSTPYFDHYNEVFLGDINDKEFIETFIKQQTNDGLYDIIIASDILFQAPINGMVGIEAIKTCFSLLKPGGFLIAGSPIQHSTPCLNDAYNKTLMRYFDANNIRCVLYDEAVKAESGIGLDETYILVKMFYKQPSDINTV